MQPVPHLADARTRVSGWWEQWRAPAASSDCRSCPDRCQRPSCLLADLHGRGELSDEEYTAAKARVLAGD